MSQALYRKWRPHQWDEVVSQEHVIQTLRNAVRTGHTGHAYLLAGPRGTGKTTTARLLAKALNCLAEDPGARPCDQCEHCQSISAGRFLDLIEIDAASNTSVDDMRSLRDKINFLPTQGRYKVYIIDEVHMLSTAAFNALLKTLEEPPPHAIFILATTEVHKIPATVLSRCQRHEFRRIPVGDIARYLRAKADTEGLAVDDEALTLIARQATGAMRDAISLLDQLSSTGNRVTLAEAQVVLGTATSAMVVELIEAVLTRDAASGLQLVQSALDAGTDARQFARQVVDYLRNLLLVRMGNGDAIDATTETRAQLARHAQGFDTPQLLEAIRLFNNAAFDTRSSWHPGLGLELALAECLEEKAPAAQPAAVQPAVNQTAGSQPAAAQPGPANRPGVDPARITAAQSAGKELAARKEPAVRIEPSARVEPGAGIEPGEQKESGRETPGAKETLAAKAPPTPPGRQGPVVRPPIDAEDDDMPEMPPFEPGEYDSPPASRPVQSGRPESGPRQSPPQGGSGGSGTNRPGPVLPRPAEGSKPTARPGQAAQTQPASPAKPVTNQPQAGKQPAGKPAAQSTAGAQPAAETTPGRSVTQQDVQQNWPRIRQMVKSKNAFSAGALNSCRSFVLKENTLILGFQSEVVKSKMETAENIDLLRQAVQSILGANLNVRCVVINSQGATPGDVNVDGDGMVGTALDLGGKIVFEE